MLKNWTKFEKYLLIANVSISFVFFYLTKDFGWLAWTGLVSSISNVACVILCARKSVTNYYWGTLGVLTYALVSYMYANTGEWMLNAFYFLPLQFVGLAARNKSVNQKVLTPTGNVDAKKLNVLQSVFFYGITVVAVVLYAWLISLGSVQMFLYGYETPRAFSSFLIASSSTMLSVVAMILMVKRYREQWVLWIVIDVLSVIIWIITFNPMMIIQWTAFLINAVYGYIKWKPTTKTEVIANV